MTYIKRDGNLYSLIVRESRFGRDVKWRSGLRKYLEEKLLPNTTFIDVGRPGLALCPSYAQNSYMILLR
jgi:hypothetical protein